MKGAMSVILFGLSFWTLAQFPYLEGTLVVPAEAHQALAARAQTLGLPIARFAPELGQLVLAHAQSEEELLAQNAFLYVDGEYFLLEIREGEWTTVLRGDATRAVLVIYGPGMPTGLSSLAFLEALGLLPPEGVVELTEKQVPPKLPAPPPGIKLDPVLWTLVDHPDWLGFAQAQGLTRVGLRVLVVAELTGSLASPWEPFVKSSSDALAELLIPIPLLPLLAQDPAVRIVRPPHQPVPLGG